MIKVCPLCKSKLRFYYKVSLSAQPEQKLDCPICGYPYYFSSDWPISKQWYVEIIQAHDTGERWSDVVNKVNEIAKGNFKTPEAISQQPIWQQFKDDVIKDTKEKLTAAVLPLNKKNLYIAGGFILAVLLLILFIKRR